MLHVSRPLRWRSQTGPRTRAQGARARPSRRPHPRAQETVERTLNSKLQICGEGVCSRIYYLFLTRLRELEPRGGTWQARERSKSASAHRAQLLYCKGLWRPSSFLLGAAKVLEGGPPALLPPGRVPRARAAAGRAPRSERGRRLSTHQLHTHVYVCNAVYFFDNNREQTWRHNPIHPYLNTEKQLNSGMYAPPVPLSSVGAASHVTASRNAGFRYPLGLREDGRLHAPPPAPHAADALYEGEQARLCRPCDPCGWVSVEAGRRVLDPCAVARVQVGELRVGGVDV